MLKTRAKREHIREAAEAAGLSGDQKLCRNLSTVKENWRRHWDSSRLARDLLHHYLIDQTVAEYAWARVEEDVFIVTDHKRRVVFASMGNGGEILFGKEVMSVLIILLDM